MLRARWVIRPLSDGLPRRAPGTRITRQMEFSASTARRTRASSPGRSSGEDRAFSGEERPLTSQRRLCDQPWQGRALVQKWWQTGTEITDQTGRGWTYRRQTVRSSGTS